MVENVNFEDKCLKWSFGDEIKAKKAVQRLQHLVKGIDDAELKVAAKVFKAMSDPCRLAILKLLKGGELCVCEIMVALDRPQSSVSHHISVLKKAGLIKERKEGKWSRYRLADGAVIEMMNLADILAGE